MMSSIPWPFVKLPSIYRNMTSLGLWPMRMAIRNGLLDKVRCSYWDKTVTVLTVFIVQRSSATLSRSRHSERDKVLCRNT
jgi:hypothetical protein